MQLALVWAHLCVCERFAVPREISRKQVRTFQELLQELKTGNMDVPLAVLHKSWRTLALTLTTEDAST